MEDVAPILLEQIKELYNQERTKNALIEVIHAKIKGKQATYIEAEQYANELGGILAKAYKETFVNLPGGKMYYNIAKRTVEPTMIGMHTDIADITDAVQTVLNGQAGLGINPVRPVLVQDKIDGIINRLANAESYDDIAWILAEPIKTFARSVVDDAVKNNAEFHAKAGMQPKIVRKMAGNCCDWCKAVAGTYIYPDVPKDVYRRHQRCRCTVDYIPNKGRKQNVWTKAWSDEVEPEKIEGRKAVESGEELTKSDVRKKLEQTNVEYRQVEYLKKELTDDEIIDKISGGDLTKGSCASLAWAYIGNKNKFDVIDYRGGNSQLFFSNRLNSISIGNLTGAKSTVIEAMDDFKGANKLLKTMVDEKEYFLATGKHAAIVKKINGDYQYLELQSSKNNGFKPLNNNILKRRFGCQKSHTFMGRKYAVKNLLVEVDSLQGNEEFRKILGYINTEVGKQMKGVKGSVK